VVADFGFRRSIIDGRSVSLLSDALVERDPDRFSSWRFGGAGPSERVPSREVPLRLRPLDPLRALFVWSRGDLRDAAALRCLMSGFPRPMRRIPLLGLTRLPHWLWFLYAIAGIRLFAGPAARFAANFDDLFVVCFYNTKSLALVYAFRAAAKNVTDIQHGLLGPTHPAYANARLWRSGSRLLPTAFLVWNAAAKEFLERVTGRPAEIRPFDDSVYFPAMPDRGEDPRPCVLVTLQWGATLPPQVVDMVARLDGVRWVLRPHPRDPEPPDDREDCRRLSLLPHVKISDPAEPLLVSLYCCDLHITENSSVVIEAAAIGRVSLFWDESIKSAFDSEISMGLARWVSADAISRILQAELFFEERRAGMAGGTDP